jgi:Tfp pilus assembly protein PilW
VLKPDPRAGDANDAGFTVVELVITVMISMVVMASLLGMLSSQTTAEQRVHDVADSQEAVRLAYVELTSDVRSADPLVAATATSIEVQLRDAAGTARTVRWSEETPVTGGLELVRREVATNGTTTVSYRLTGVAAGTLFTYFKAGLTPVAVPTGDESSCAKRVQISLRATPEGRGAPLLLQSDVDLRNARVSVGC